MQRLIRFDGTVAEILPDGRFRVSFPNGHAVTADGLSEGSDSPAVGDTITVEMPAHSSGTPQLFFRRLNR